MTDARPRPEPPVSSAASGTERAVSARDVTLAREAAGDALLEYAEALRSWNAPDDEHTRHQLRGLVDDVIQEVGLRV